MSNVVMLLGKSGTGKSTSIKGLNPKETIVINVLGKRLPFKGSNSLYNKENKNLFQKETYTEIVSLLTSISDKCPQVRNVVLDDLIYVMRKEYFSRAKETVVINVLGKRLPFKGSNSLYNKENKNLFQRDTYTEIISLVQNISDKAANVKNIILDD